MGIWLKPSQQAQSKLVLGPDEQMTGKEAHNCLWTWSCEGPYLREGGAYMIKQSGEVSDSDIIWTLDLAVPDVIIQWIARGLLKQILKYYHHSLIVANHTGNEDSILSLVLLAKWKSRAISFHIPVLD